MAFKVSGLGALTEADVSAEKTLSAWREDLCLLLGRDVGGDVVIRELCPTLWIYRDGDGDRAQCNSDCIMTPTEVLI